LQLNVTDNVILVALLNACGRSVTANRTKDFYADQWGGGGGGWVVVNVILSAGIPVLQSTVAVVDSGLLNRSQELEAEVEGLWATIVPPSAVEQVKKMMDDFRQQKLSLNGSVGDGTTFK
jgi:hypothetical protein